MLEEVALLQGSPSHWSGVRFVSSGAPLANRLEQFCAAMIEPISKLDRSPVWAHTPLNVRRRSSPASQHPRSHAYSVAAECQRIHATG